MRPKKTNFGLSFGHFWSANCEGEKGSEEEEEEEERYGSMELYGTMVLYGF